MKITKENAQSIKEQFAVRAIFGKSRSLKEYNRCIRIAWIAFAIETGNPSPYKHPRLP